MNRRLVSTMARGMVRLMDEHEDCGGKNKRELLFSYTCKDGSEVLADSFRIGNLTVILKDFIGMPAKGPEMERCIESMADYVRRSEEVSPAMMRDRGDVDEFVSALAWAAAERRVNAEPFLGPGYFDVATRIQNL